ncbi:MAG TPA: thiamine-phosphate kinase [Terracidiphilus sp.]|nr:thiamine-phosphate kinase [Terracidiphilus sp.]
MRTKRTESFDFSSAIERGELTLLSQIRKRAARVSGLVPLGIGDDCALLRLSAGEELAVTTDLSIDGRHFQLDWHPPESVGHRALARGLSDLAAMGARPVAAFLSLGLPRRLTTAPSGENARSSTWVARFYDGLLALGDAYKTPLAGGDLAESPVALADIVLAGVVPRGKALLRSGARVGEPVYVTGTLGGAAAGLGRLRELAEASSPARRQGRQPALRAADELASQLAAHLYPQPRVEQGLRLRRHGLASAAIDISDGLSTDLAHLCEESGVASEIDAAMLPVHAGASLAQALDGGEDYELLFTAPAKAQVPREIAGVPVTRIGRMVRRRAGRAQITLISAQGKVPIEAHGWEHFS